MKNDFRLFNDILSDAICDNNVKNTNTYIPNPQKDQRTIIPEEILSYKEFREHINQQLKIR